MIGPGGAELLWLVALLLLALIPAKIAANKGHSFVAFYTFGVFLWLIALIVALVIKPKEQARVA